jgi:hypothetical protein
VAGLFRELPPDSFDCSLSLTNVQWRGDNPVFRWEFWDSPDNSYNYGPSYLTAVILQLTLRGGKAIVQVATFDKNGKTSSLSGPYGFPDSRWIPRGETMFPDLRKGVSFRARWRESTKSWKFSYGLQGEKPIREIPGGSFVEEITPNPDGKRNLIYVRRASREKGFAVSLGAYSLWL